MGIYLVTGSSGDIGSDICEKILENESNSILGIDIKPSRINNTRYRHIELNLGNLKEIEKVDWEKFNISTVIHTAGVYKSKLIEEYDLNSITYTVNVNVISIVVIIQQLLSKSTNTKLENIIMISCTAEKLGSRDPVYSLSKSAIVGVLKSFEKTLNCRINVVSPGLIDTKMSRENQTIQRKQYHVNNTLAKRMGKIEDVTNLVMFLLSNKSSYIWGENIYINGGML